MNMTAIQICALIGLIIGAALLYWTGYRGGLADGRIEGIDEGTNNQRAESAKTIREPEASLQFIRADHQRLTQHCKNLKDSKALGEEHHQILLDIAEQLRIAAETFSAFRTGKKLERETRTLRDQALVMAERLEPVSEDGPAKLHINQLGIQHAEESAMRMNLPTHTSSALVCSVACVDAQKTNNLCCAAAGITACICANAGTLIPHQKLRDADLPDATLIAQDRPLVQPVVGYTRVQTVAMAQVAV